MEPATQMMIDTHCHLFAEEFDSDRDEAVFRASAAGVKLMLMPNIDVETVSSLKLVHEEYLENCLPMMGLHPCSIKEDYKIQLEKIHSVLDCGKFIGIGEIGLDYYWDTSFTSEQKDAFREQIIWAKYHKLPIAIHTRNSFEDAIKIVEEEKTDDLRGVFHCFTGSIDDARKIIDLGFMMGIGGVVTFKNGGLDKVLPEISLDYIVLETDAPYLAPAPCRGKRNEPSYLTHIAEKISLLLNIPLEEIKEHTTKNARNLFNV